MFVESGGKGDSKGWWGSTSCGKPANEFGGRADVGGQWGSLSVVKCYGMDVPDIDYTGLFHNTSTPGCGNSKTSGRRWLRCSTWRNQCQDFFWLPMLIAAREEVGILYDLIDQDASQTEEGVEQWKGHQAAAETYLDELVGRGAYVSESRLLGSGTNATFCRDRVPGHYSSPSCVNAGATYSAKSKCKVDNVWVYPVEYYVWQAAELRREIVVLQAIFRENSPIWPPEDEVQEDLTTPPLNLNRDAQPDDPFVLPPVIAAVSPDSGKGALPPWAPFAAAALAFLVLR